VSVLNHLFLSLRKRGIAGTISLLGQKRKKHSRLQKLLGAPSGSAILSSFPTSNIAHPTSSQASYIEKADAMLLDDNYFFTFPYRTRGLEDPWNFDPLENRSWPKRQYEETRVHGQDTPRDVKIVWEINRFKDLPALGVAAFLSGDARYAEEVRRRLHSWIVCNPFGNTVNWSSPLEIAIRGISWIATLRLLHQGGFKVQEDKAIQQSLWQHVTYLNASLSIDKILRSNHLIGETAGLYILSSLLDFPEAAAFRHRAKVIHSDAVLEQTYSDGVSREASGWYHGFVTDFAELVSRTAHSNGDVMTERFNKRLEQMIVYRNSIFATDSGIVKYGDFDNGRVLALSSEWIDAIVGISPLATKIRKAVFENGKHVTVKIEKNYFFVRAGEFGWGGNGFSSHAHDDLLCPVVYLDGNPILADAGTYVYVGDPQLRDQFRDARSHNNIIIGTSTGAQMKPYFGWQVTRKPAILESHSKEEKHFTAVGSYAEWKGKHQRTFVLDDRGFTLHDDLDLPAEEPVEWHFHFHPRWRLKQQDGHTFAIADFRDQHYRFELSAGVGEFELAEYEYSASYMEKSKAQKLILRQTIQPGKQRYTFAITRAS
jgi:hypothetical protein